MVLKKGDFVKIDYSIWRNSDGTLVKTTEKEIAEKNDAYSAESIYGPQLVVLGKDGTIKGIQDSLKDMDVGQSKKFDLTPQDAFGERSKDLVRVMPLSDFRRRDIDPVPGMQIDLDGAIATVKSVNSGRVMIDANHPLSGENLTCSVKVISKLTEGADKLKAIFGNYRLEPSSVEFKENSGKVAFDSKIKKDSRFLVDKASAVAFAFQCIDSLESIKVEEEYSRETDKEMRATPE